MLWVSEQLVQGKAVQVFHCESCDKYAAATPESNGVKTPLAATTSAPRAS